MTNVIGADLGGLTVFLYLILSAHPRATNKLMEF